MPSKLPLTPQGVDQKQVELYSLPDADLIDQAKEISQNFAKWVNANFELSETQLDYLTTISELDSLITGWWLASAVVSRGTIVMDDVTPPQPTTAKKKKKLTVQGSTTYNPTTGATTTTVSASMSWEW